MKVQLLLILLLIYTTVIQVNVSACAPISISSADTTRAKKSSIIDSIIKLSEGNYPVQLGAFKMKSNAEKLSRNFEVLLGEDVIIIEDNGYYKVRLVKKDYSKQMIYLSPPALFDTINGEKKGVLFRFGTNKTTDSISDTMQIRAAIVDSIRTPGFSYKNQILESAGKIRHKFIFLNNNNPWLKRINYFGRSVVLVKGLFILIIGSILMMIVLLIFILFNRTRMEKEEKLRQFLMEKYQGLIVDYLFGDNLSDEFNTIASDKFRRQVLIDQIIDVSINLKGEAEAKLQKLYLNLGLDRDSVNRAYSGQWHKKIKGFRELAFMNIREANAEISRCLESKNDILRIEAQIAMVRLNDDNPFEFLYHYERPFSLWEQITLYELLVQHEMKVPSFSQWLNSPNDTVVIFSLRMIREFKQVDSEKDVLKVLQHKSPEVRKTAIEVTGDLGMKQALKTLKKMYKNENYDNCLEILRSMVKMPDETMLGFLKMVLDKEDDIQLQIEATKGIQKMGEEGVRALVKIMESEYKNYNIIIRHVLDKRIN